MVFQGLVFTLQPRGRKTAVR